MLKDGVLVNLNYHQNRLIRSMDELFSGREKIDLANEISIPKDCNKGTFKVRVTYGPTIEKVEIEPYIVRTINSLKIVYHDMIDYHLKYSDRKELQQLFDQRENCDDIIIVKNEVVTDSFAANLLFFDGECWFTPDSPLLHGTQRQFLIEKGLVFEKEIRVGELTGFQKVGLINAMIDFNEMPVIDFRDIVF